MKIIPETCKKKPQLEKDKLTKKRPITVTFIDKRVWDFIILVVYF